jgi:hypothetical protein
MIYIYYFCLQPKNKKKQTFVLSMESAHFIYLLYSFSEERKIQENDPAAYGF